MLETGLNLYQPVRYTRSDKEWFSDFDKALQGSSQQRFNIDVSAVLSILSLYYPCGDRTLFKEIKRQPWLSSISQDGRVNLEAIHPHGFIWDSSENIANKLNKLLLDEAEKACYGKDEIYILLSGGLDSRIVAGVLYQLQKQGRLKSKPIGVTWGLDDSRDVHYARATAEILGFDWKHLSMDSGCILENIYEGFSMIGGLVSPYHLHRMLWFKNNVSSDALVLAGSYGDSIGRAEFSGKHMLELDFLTPANIFGLIKQELIPEAIKGIQQDLQLLHQRAGNDCPKYAICEFERHGHYMRGMIAHASNVINKWCTLHQMFTAPQVYGYIWSLHPARRDNSIYASLLEKLHTGLARLPWARTNKALSGRTIGAKKRLRKQFHEYEKWSSNELYSEIKKLVDPDWFEATGIFDPVQVDFLNTSLSPRSNNLRSYGGKPYDIWLWLAGFRVWREKLQREDKGIKTKNADILPKGNVNIVSGIRGCLSHLLGGNPIYKITSSLQKWWAKKKSIRQWPPIYSNRVK